MSMLAFYKVCNKIIIISGGCRIIWSSNGAIKEKKQLCFLSCKMKVQFWLSWIKLDMSRFAPHNESVKLIFGTKLMFSPFVLIVLPCAPCPAVHFLPVVPWCVSHLCCCLWSALLKVCLDGDTPNPIFCVDLVLCSHNEKKALVVRGAFNTICSAQCGGTFPLSQHQAPEQQLDSFRTDWNREPRLMSLERPVLIKVF